MAWYKNGWWQTVKQLVKPLDVQANQEVVSNMNGNK